MTQELEFLLDVSKQAAAMITDDFVVRAKGDQGDLITNFDEEIEQFIISKIKENYPAYDIISEEFNSDVKATDNYFTIDPIDGTVNFAHGLPIWGIQIACVQNGKTVAAVINMPKLNEIYYADKNGAFKNGKPIKVNLLPIAKCLYAVEGVEKLPGIIQMQKHVKGFRFVACACADFAWVASGVLGGAFSDMTRHGTMCQAYI